MKELLLAIKSSKSEADHNFVKMWDYDALSWNQKLFQAMKMWNFQETGENWLKLCNYIIS